MVEIVRPNWGEAAPAFAGALLNPDLSVPDFLTSASGANDPLRYAVYRNNVIVSLVRAMESNFPSIVRLVGREYFTQLARYFVQTHPPRTRLMFEYGAQFPQFLEQFEPLKSYPYLADVSRIEEAWRAAFHEGDCAPLAPERLQEIAPDDIANLAFVAHPATRFIASNYAAGSIFVANRTDGAEQPADAFAPEYVLVTRPHFDCSVRILNGANGVFVDVLLKGLTLGEAAAAAVAVSDQFDLSIAISGVLDAGAFQGFVLA